MRETITSTFVTALEVGSGGTVLVTFDTSVGKIPELGSSNEIEFSPRTVEGAVRWECSGPSGATAVEDRYRPARCR
jgi:hypothetical protein